MIAISRDGYYLAAPSFGTILRDVFHILSTVTEVQIAFRRPAQLGVVDDEIQTSERPHGPLDAWRRSGPLRYVAAGGRYAASAPLVLVDHRFGGVGRKPVDGHGRDGRREPFRDSLGNTCRAAGDTQKTLSMYDFFRTTLFKLDPEWAHRLATAAAWTAQATRVDHLLENSLEFDDIRLEQSIWGQGFSNPIGLAAGFDKNATLIPFWPALGFGFAEVGSVSAQPSHGNPRPRAFRLEEDEALINRMGLNNKGASNIARRLRRVEARRRIPIGVNLAKTHDPEIMGEAAIEDFRASFELMAPLADYVALNISCPNTREGKTFEDPKALEALLRAVMTQRRESAPRVPVLLKLSPSLSDRVMFDSAVEAAVELGRKYGIAGYIATNTAADRDGVLTCEERLEEIGPGGLSGRPLEARATHLVRYLHARTEGSVPIIGVGGIFTAEDAYRKIRAGASLVQLYTGLVYRGPSLVREIKKGLIALIERDGFASIGDAVGADAIDHASR